MTVRDVKLPIVHTATDKVESFIIDYELKLFR